MNISLYLMVYFYVKYYDKIILVSTTLRSVERGFRYPDIRGYEICGFHGGDVSSRGLLNCGAVWCCGRIPTFQRSLVPPSSG
jgi:hypothetical protein